MNSNSALIILTHDPRSYYCKRFAVDECLDLDFLAGIACFGPCAKAAQIEASKKYAKDFMQRHAIPTARYKSFTDIHDACSFIEQ